MLTPLWVMAPSFFVHWSSFTCFSLTRYIYQPKGSSQQWKNPIPFIKRSHSHGSNTCSKAHGRNPWLSNTCHHGFWGFPGPMMFELHPGGKRPLFKQPSHGHGFFLSVTDLKHIWINPVIKMDCNRLKWSKIDYGWSETVHWSVSISSPMKWVTGKPRFSQSCRYPWINLSCEASAQVTTRLFQGWVSGNAKSHHVSVSASGRGVTFFILWSS